MLGGSFFQVPAIKYAKDAGYYVITCDYLPDNPGHKYADEYYNLSTTDKEGVLELAKTLNIDGIVAYASDPAAPTAAYVSEKLNLPGNSYDSVKILTEKDLFRDFLTKNDFNVPRACGYISFENLLLDISKFNFPVMLKPVDSSGSKGVSKVLNIDGLKEAYDYAISFSRSSRVILEEFIEGVGPQMHGDAFVVDGKLIFSYLGDHHYNSAINPFVPFSTTIPSCHSVDVLNKVDTEIQKLIDKLKLKQGALNIEARLGTDNLVYLMEVGPRNGGNLVPQLECYASGFDMLAASVDVALGELEIDFKFDKKGNFAYYVLHSHKEGILEDISIDKYLNDNILEKHYFKVKGDQVAPFNGSNATIGILLLKFDDSEDMQMKINNMNKYIDIRVS